MKTRDVDLLAESYRIVREQSPLLNNPMVAAAQGAVQGVQPYMAGTMAGVQQLGQNLAGAVAGSPRAPQSPVAAGQQAFNQQQVDQILDSVLKAYNLPANMKQQVSTMLQQMAGKINQTKQAMNQYNVDQALQSTGQQVTPQMNVPPRINPIGGTDPDGFSIPMVKPGYTTGGTVPASQSLQSMQRAANMPPSRRY